MSATTCTRCGAGIAAGAHFCSLCGFDVSGQQAALATEQMAAPSATRTMQVADFATQEQLEHLREAIIGEYDLYGELGRGGMATVYLAHDIALDRKVAIKVMSPSLVQGEGMVERFKREARTAASLSHPNIIPVYAVRETDRILYFVMKFVQGRPLDSIIKEVGKLPIPMVQAILSQVGGAFGYAHRRGIIHRDIKPANIMIDDEGWAVVTDFGIAKVSESAGLTMTGMTVGTPTYMSPEQCMAQEVTGASDQYSLGVVAYEMITGRPPFTGGSMMAIMYGHFNDPPPPIESLRPDCPEELRAAVIRMLEKEPAKRWPSVEEAVAGIGAKPLNHDDPTRTQMVALAKAGSEKQLSLKVSTPSSPIPLGKKTSRVITAGSPTARMRTPGAPTRPITVSSPAPQRSSKGLLIGGGVVVAGAVAGLLVLAPWKPKTASTPTAPAPQVIDSAKVSVPVTPAVTAPTDSGAQQTAVPAPPPPSATTASGANKPAKPAPQKPSQANQAAASAAALSAQRDDSIFQSVMALSLDARRRAVAEGATAAELAPGDAIRDNARSAYTQDRAIEGVSLLNRATQAWTQAGDQAKARIAAESAAAAKPVAPVVTAPATPAAPAVDEKAEKKEIERVILDYGRVMESGDIAAMRRANPNLPRRIEKGIKDLYDAGGHLKTNWSVGDAQIEGSTARAHVGGSNTVTIGGRDNNAPVNFDVTLERAAGGWRIISADR